MHGLAWSRDGRLAFVADVDGSGQPELYVAEKPWGGHQHKITGIQGYLAKPQWSPDGTRIALLWIQGETRVPGPTEATKPDSGVVESKIAEQRLTMVDLASSKAHTVSPSNMYVYEFDWAPDGNQIAYLAAPGAGDDNWFVAELIHGRRWTQAPCTAS